MAVAKDYDTSRMANFGRDAAKAYAGLLRTQERLVDEINAAIEAGVKPIKISYDLMGRCATQEATVNLLTVLTALTRMEKIPSSILEPFEKGIYPKRV